MRVALLSDVHGNLAALESILDALSPFDAIWHLGDVVGYGPDPVGVVQRLQREGALGVRGNHDAAAIGEIGTDLFNDAARRAVEWSAQRLTPAARRWLAGNPHTRVEGAFTLAHGSPRDPLWEYMFSTSLARTNLAAFSTPYCLVGHTHVPLAFRESEGGMDVIVPRDGTVIELDDRRTILNPGGVGQPRDGDPRASGALLDTTAGTVMWRRTLYPVGVTQRAMRVAGLPQRLIDRLEQGF
ncbi:MAG TPA: metallophosphoesterase family protein [Candidatus Acidoferrales bacterium]|nr:metallophosphoesterase family protein [Candidatus Acidoferrales bacterium]